MPEKMQLEQSRQCCCAAKQEADTRSNWKWVEASIWTERMLAALVNGVKGGKWYSLFDKVCSRCTMSIAWKKVESNRGAAGVDKISIKRFRANADGYLDELASALKEGTYQPLPVRRVYIYPKARLNSGL